MDRDGTGRVRGAPVTGSLSTGGIDSVALPVRTIRTCEPLLERDDIVVARHANPACRRAAHPASGAGAVTRLSRGVYRLPDADLDPNHSLAASQAYVGIFDNR